MSDETDTKFLQDIANSIRSINMSPTTNDPYNNNQSKNNCLSMPSFDLNSYNNNILPPASELFSANSLVSNGYPPSTFFPTNYSQSDANPLPEDNSKKLQQSSVRVNLGIDENLDMVLQMDSTEAVKSIIPIEADFSASDSAFSCEQSNVINNNKSSEKVLGLPPKSGGYVTLKFSFPFVIYLNVIHMWRISKKNSRKHN